MGMEYLPTVELVLRDGENLTNGISMQIRNESNIV